MTARRSVIVQECEQIVQINVTRPNTTRIDSQAVWLHEGQATCATHLDERCHQVAVDSEFIASIPT